MARRSWVLAATLGILASLAIAAPAAAVGAAAPFEASKQSGKPSAPSNAGSQADAGAIAGASYFGHVAINENKGCNSFEAGMYFHTDGTASFSFNGGAWEDDRYNWSQSGDTVTLTISRGETWRLSVIGATLSGTYDDGSCTGTMTLTRG